MKVNRLYISNIRNHRLTELELNDSLNIFHGLNGTGKTSVLEAVSICGFSKSFMPSTDSSIVREGEETYIINCKAANDYSIPYQVAVSYSIGRKKKINSTFGDNLNPKDIIGELPMIILTPDYKMITFGSPSDRRDFLDRLLSQANRLYMEELIKLKKALKQRNNLLFHAKTGKDIGYSLIEPWNDVFVKAAAEIIIKRRNFIDDFIPYFQDIYNKISEQKEEVGIMYLPDSLEDVPLSNLSKHGIIDIYSKKLISEMREEYSKGSTSIGPQKDELKITINGRVARDTASQGQHKSLLISIKFAEFEFLKNQKNETPIVLLDDIFAELDNERIYKVIQLIKEHNAQTLITLTDKRYIEGFLGDIPFSSYYIEKGMAFPGK